MDQDRSTDLADPDQDAGKRWLLPLCDINELGLRLAMVVISGEGDVPEAVSAIRLGALDYKRKPIDPPHPRQLLTTLTDYIDTCGREPFAVRAAQRSGRRRRTDGRQVAGDAAGDYFNRAARGLVGVGGYHGRERYWQGGGARTTHDLSRRRNAPYIVVKCAAMPGTLIESKLFGHERGAFTRADRRKRWVLRAGQWRHAGTSWPR